MVDGVLVFHEGDTFTLSLHLNIKNMGATVGADEMRQVIGIFRDPKGKCVQYFNEEPDENRNVKFIFTTDVTKNFKKGRYEYDIGLVTPYTRETIADRLSLEVI